jgi:hypothetical protein
MHRSSWQWTGYDGLFFLATMAYVIVDIGISSARPRLPAADLFLGVGFVASAVLLMFGWAVLYSLRVRLNWTSLPAGSHCDRSPQLLLCHTCVERRVAASPDP